jgi:hypothetical protein
MKNVSLDRATVLQLYTHGTDGALNAAADCDILGNHTAIDRCAFGDQEVGSPQLACNSAEDLSWTIAFDLTNDRHVGADAGVRSRFWRRRLRPWRSMLNGCAGLLRCPSHEFVRICRRVPVLLGCLALEAVQHDSRPCSLNVPATRHLSPCDPAQKAITSSRHSVDLDWYFFGPHPRLMNVALRIINDRDGYGIRALSP